MQDGEFYARLAELGALKTERLGRQLSNRVLADQAGMSPATIGRWLRGERLPSDIGKLITVVRVIAASATENGVTVPDGLLDPDYWREAYRAEVGRRSSGAADSASGVTDLRALAQVAQNRGLLRDAAHLRRRAAVSGDPMAAAELINQLRGAFPDFRDLPWPVAEHVALSDPMGVANLIDELKQIGAAGQLSVLLARDPGSHADCGDPDGAITLLEELRKAGGAAQASVLADRLAAGAALGNPAQVIRLISGLRGAGAYAQIAALIARDPAGQVALDDPELTVALILELRMAGADDQARTLADRADRAGIPRARAALSVDLDDHEEAFAFRFIHGSYEPDQAAFLFNVLANAGWTDKIQRFLALDPLGTMPLEDGAGVARLLATLQSLRADEQIRVLLARDPAAHVAPGNLSGAVQLLDALRQAGVRDQSPHDLAKRVEADDPHSLALVLKMLAEDGSAAEVAALLERCPAARVGLREAEAVAGLLQLLRALGAEEYRKTLVDRLPGEGHFALFLAQDDHAARYRFGRNPDGTPADPWHWQDLG